MAGWRDEGRQLSQAFVVLGMGAAGGAIFRLLGLPLPWMLGALAAAALLSCARPHLVLPSGFRGGARPIIGVMAGSAFSPAVVEGISTWWPMLIVLSAFFASMPGGLGEMTLLDSQFGADLRRLVLVHSVRIVIVVTMVPFILRLSLGHHLLASSALPHAGSAVGGSDWLILAACAGGGFLLGRPLRSFGGGMIMALLLSAIVHGSGVTAAAPPTWLVAGMQVVIGCITGARFVGVSLAEARTALWQGGVWAAILLAMSFAAALLSTLVVRQPQHALFLALAPGGFAEMSIIALAAGIEVAFVVTCHAFSTICIVLVAPSLYQFALRRQD